MASMFGPLPGVVRLLDAGAGAGALTTAFVTRLCRKNEDVEVIEATLYEIDTQILDALTANMLKCQRLAASAGIRFTFVIHSADFIEEMSARLAGNLFGTPPPEFDAAITNPPYKKMPQSRSEWVTCSHRQNSEWLPSQRI